MPDTSRQVPANQREDSVGKVNLEQLFTLLACGLVLFSTGFVYLCMRMAGEKGVIIFGRIFWGLLGATTSGMLLFAVKEATILLGLPPGLAVPVTGAVLVLALLAAFERDLLARGLLYKVDAETGK